MLNKFTWGDFLLAATILMTAYYVVVAILFFRSEIRDLLSGKTKIKSKDISEDYTDPGEMEDADFDELESVVANLKISIREQAGNQASKVDLLRHFQQELANYDGLHRPAYRVAINHSIIEEAKASCGISFTEKELDAAWESMA